jgi:hypothetical protein
VWLSVLVNINKTTSVGIPSWRDLQSVPSILSQFTHRYRKIASCGFAAQAATKIKKSLC